MKNENNKPKQQEKVQPVFKTQIGGLQIATWKNVTNVDGKDQTFLNSSITKSYLDKDTNKWEKSESFSVNDLLKLQIAIGETIKYCLIESKKENEIEDD